MHPSSNSLVIGDPCHLRHARVNVNRRRETHAGSAASGAIPADGIEEDNPKEAQAHVVRPTGQPVLIALRASMQDPVAADPAPHKVAEHGEEVEKDGKVVKENRLESTLYHCFVQALLRSSQRIALLPHVYEDLLPDLILKKGGEQDIHDGERHLQVQPHTEVNGRAARKPASRRPPCLERTEAKIKFEATHDQGDNHKGAERLFCEVRALLAGLVAALLYGLAVDLFAELAAEAAQVPRERADGLAS